MRIKRFFATDIRQAIKMVRDELGPDAVILSNTRVDGGIEIVSAIDYDEALFSIHSEKKKVLREVDKKHNDRKIDKQESNIKPAVSELPYPRTKVKAKSSTHSTGADEQKAKLVWSQEPTLIEMRKELQSLRGLLENQLSGLAWGDLKRRSPMKVELLQRLTKLGLSANFCNDLLELSRDDQDINELWCDSQRVLADKIPVVKEDILDEGGVIALVGPTGVGKTTTIAKLASRFALRHGARQVGLVTIDNYRIGAYEQLRSYGRILGIPVRVASKNTDLRTTLDDMRDRRLVLIDTVGMSQRDLRLTEQFSLLKDDCDWLKTFLVLSTTTRLSSLEEITRVYKGAELAGCILTKLDETTSLGSALSTIIEHKLPVAYVSDGQRVPEDLHRARATTLVKQSIDIMDKNQSLIEGELFTNTPGRIQTNAYV